MVVRSVYAHVKAAGLTARSAVGLRDLFSYCLFLFPNNLPEAGYSRFL